MTVVGRLPGGTRDEGGAAAYGTWCLCCYAISCRTETGSAPDLQPACCLPACCPHSAFTISTPLLLAAPRAGAATELLSYMCVTPLFYQRLMLHDESGAAPLRLVLACLTLHDTPMAAPPFARSTDKATSAATSKLVAVQPPYCTEKGEGAAELLAARGFALLLMLSECEQPSFMDQVAQHAATRRLADHVNNRAAAYMGQVGGWGEGGW